MRKVDIRFGRLFPWPFVFLAALVAIVAVALIIEKPAVSIIMLVICGLILTASEGTVIDPAKKTYLEYKSFFFIKTGTEEKYSGIERIFINSSKKSQQFYTAHTLKSSVFENIVYNGFLKFDDGTKVQLLQKRKKTDLLSKLEYLARTLNVPLVDNTVC